MNILFRGTSLVLLTLSLLIASSRSPADSASQQSSTQHSNAGVPKASPRSEPSSQEIADAQAKGLVWVNLSTHVYHKEGPLYGKTKRGKFMTEEDAKKAGYRPAKENPA